MNWIASLTKLEITMIRNYSLTIVIIFCASFLADLKSQCVGEAGTVTWSHWYDLPYRTWDAFFANEDIPDFPDYTQNIGSLNTPDDYTEDYGSMIRGYISVPTSGTATFNLTGDDQTRFY